MKQEQKCRWQAVLNKVKESLSDNKQCIAAFYLGDIDRDEFSERFDMQIIVIVDDHYKGGKNYRILEDGISVRIRVYEVTTFKQELDGSFEEGSFWYQFAKRTRLFSKDISLDEFIEDAYYIGEAQSQQELLIRFSGAVYYLNKAEKNLYVKENIENVTYFMPQLAENIAYLEVLLNKEIPKTEIIPQAKSMNPKLFHEIYDPLFDTKVSKEILERMVSASVSYLEAITAQVYEPVISYLMKHGNLDHFTYVTRPYTFGLNYEWLVRVGIAKRYGLMDRVPIFKEQVCTLGYMLNKDSNVNINRQGE